MFKNIIFDFDGVIINSHDVQVKALTESFRTICGKGVPPYNDFFKLSGNSLKNIFIQLGLPLDMIPIYEKISRENIGLIKVHKGMIELLQKLNEMNCNCALCTGKDSKRTFEILKHLNLNQFFSIVVCSDEVKNPKPHPESILLIIEKLDAIKDNTVMIGDGINDIVAAKNAGITSIAVTWGDVKERDLKNSLPNLISESTEKLYKIIINDTKTIYN